MKRQRGYADWHGLYFVDGKLITETFTVIGEKMPERNTGSRSRSMRTRTTRGPVPPGTPQGVGTQIVETPDSLTDQRRRQIVAVSKQERAAKKEYDDALRAVNECDPLSVGYDECQWRLQKAAQLLLTMRDGVKRTITAQPFAEE